MKKIRMVLLALISITGIGAALATNYKASNQFSTYTYYAVKLGTHSWHWTKNRPLGIFVCGTLMGCSCTINSTISALSNASYNGIYLTSFVPSTPNNHVYE